MSLVTFFWIVVAVACVGLCAYGINTGIRRARERRRQDALTPR